MLDLLEFSGRMRKRGEQTQALYISWSVATLVS